MSIFVRYLKGKISILSVYIDNFLLISNRIDIFKALKKFLTKEYNIKNLGKEKTIIK